MDVTQNDVERGKIAEYQQKIKALDEDERKLRDIRAQLHDLSFSAGPRDNAKIRELSSTVWQSFFVRNRSLIPCIRGVFRAIRVLSACCASRSAKMRRISG